VIRPMLG
jgi:Domain of unknown function (DUF6487)